MNFQEEIKYFSAVAYDRSIYNFSVNAQGEICCIEFGITYKASIIEIKPNFVLRGADSRTVYSLDDHLRNRNKKKQNGLSLISEWIIPEDVFEYLLNNKKLFYSVNTAILYGFDPQYAFDNNRNKRAFKWSKNNPTKRAKILAPQKSGKFN